MRIAGSMAEPCRLASTSITRRSPAWPAAGASGVNVAGSVVMIFAPYGSELTAQQIHILDELAVGRVCQPGGAVETAGSAVVFRHRLPPSGMRGCRFPEVEVALLDRRLVAAVHCLCGDENQGQHPGIIAAYHKGRRIRGGCYPVSS